MECIVCGNWFSSTNKDQKLCMTCERVLQHPSIGIAPERLLELSQAERDGRLVVHGRWIKIDNPAYSPFDRSSPYLYLCDQCHEKEQSEKRFCPNCGAKMDLE